MNDVLKKMWREAVVGYFGVLSQHFPGVIRENHEKHQSPGQDPKAGPPEHSSGSQ